MNRLRVSTGVYDLCTRVIPGEHKCVQIPIMFILIKSILLNFCKYVYKHIFKFLHHFIIKSLCCQIPSLSNPLICFKKYMRTFTGEHIFFNQCSLKFFDSFHYQIPSLSNPFICFKKYMSTFTGELLGLGLKCIRTFTGEHILL